jgi:hypothetical protein
MKNFFKQKKLQAVYGLLLLASAFLFQKCSDQPAVEFAEQDKKKQKTGMDNPYSTEIVVKAFENLVKSDPAGRTASAPPSSTHYYTRFTPQNEQQLMDLYETGLELYERPLDENVAANYTVPAGDFVPLFTLVPANYPFPSNIPHQVISQVILFNEDSGDENDPDPWDPEPDPGICTVPPCPCYGPEPCPIAPPRDDIETSRKSKREDLVIKTTKLLRQAGIDLAALTDEMYRLSGNEDDILFINESSAGRIASHRYFPSGVIRVRDNVINQNMPVRGVAVKARRWFKLATALTDANGNFTINTGYRNQAHIAVEFRSIWATVRGIRNALAVWEYILPLRRSLGNFNENNLQNINFTFPYVANASTPGALQWVAANFMTTFWDHRQNCSTQLNMMGHPAYLNVWLSSAITNAASAPMLRAITDPPLINSAISHLMPGRSLLELNILTRFLPDITLRIQDPNTGNTRNANLISNTFFHELAHTTHWDKAGNAYWLHYISYIITNGGYGTRNSSNVGYVAVGEAWGFYLGNTFNDQKYRALGEIVIANRERDQLEVQTPNNNVPVRMFANSSEGWIPYGMLNDLIDVGEPAATGVVDNVAGYTRAGLYRAFHQGSTSVPLLREAIKANNGNNQAPQVDQLVTSYGW